MKTVLPITILLILLIVFGVLSYQRIHVSAEELLSQIDSIEALVNAEKWQEAKFALDGLKEAWKGTSTLWSILLNHREMENIELSISKLDRLIASKNITLIPSEIATLRLFIGHIPEKETFALKNIF